jgi:16S rRNA processing protein RimM
MSSRPPGESRDRSSLAVAGVVGKPLGLHGEVYVHPDPDVVDQFEVGRSYRASRPVAEDAGASGSSTSAGERRMTVVSSRVHAGRRLVRFDGIGNRDAAEALRGLVLSVPRDEVALDENAFWADALLGREVVDAAGGLIGVLESTLDGHAHDFLVVARPDGGEVLIPAVAELVDLTGERIVVQTIPGLLDET